MKGGEDWEEKTRIPYDRQNQQREEGLFRGKKKVRAHCSFKGIGKKEPKEKEKGVIRRKIIGGEARKRGRAKSQNGPQSK